MNVNRADRRMMEKERMNLEHSFSWINVRMNVTRDDQESMRLKNRKRNENFDEIYIRSYQLFLLCSSL